MLHRGKPHRVHGKAQVVVVVQIMRHARCFAGRNAYVPHLLWRGRSRACRYKQPATIREPNRLPNKMPASASKRLLRPVAQAYAEDSLIAAALVVQARLASDHLAVGRPCWRIPDHSK